MNFNISVHVSFLPEKVAFVTLHMLFCEKAKQTKKQTQKQTNEKTLFSFLVAHV